MAGFRLPEDTLAGTLRAVRKPIANSLVFALVLLVIFLIWARAASMVHIFFPATGMVHLSDLVLYLGVGSTIGAFFAYVCFAAAVFSLPFIANRDVDVITASCNSKSTLRAVADEFTLRHENVHYFPAFEMATIYQPLIGLTYFSNGRENYHVNKSTVKFIMRHFFKFYGNMK